MDPIIQGNFAAGMDLFSEDHMLQAGAYKDGFNVRIRTGAMQSINGCLEDATAPSGKKQGLFGFEQYLLLFNNGGAYYKIIDEPDFPWTKLDGFFLSPSVDYIYAAALPASTTNLLRVIDPAKVNGNVLNDTSGTKGIVINGTEAGLL